MKYSFTRRQPAENARSTLPSRSSSVTFLFTTSRMRCVPASGANVSPLFLPPAGHEPRHLDAERVHTQGRQRHRDAGALEPALQPSQDLLELAVIGGRERRERHLVVAAARQARHDVTHDGIGGALTHGAVDHPRLAEAAPARTAAQHLDAETVVHDVHERHDRLDRRPHRVKVGDDALDDQARARRRSG